MKVILALTKRNIRLFFKDKGMFLTSLITPVILLVLYASFLGGVFRDSFLMNIPDGISVDENIIDGLVGGQLISSILAVSCITVSFCSNFLMVQDRANGSVKDLTVSPLKPSTLAVSYYLATLASTLTICLTATAICLAYVAAVGWYLSFTDVLLLILDVIILVLFGTALSSVISFFLTTQGQISAVGTIVSSGYGFICGAYMPISSFGEGLQTVISFLPGTYGTVLVRNHAMRGALAALEEAGLPAAAVTSMRDAIDCNIYFFEKSVPTSAMFLIVSLTAALLLAAYVLENKFLKKQR